MTAPAAALASSRPSTHTALSAKEAALVGALRAFRPPPPPTRPVATAQPASSISLAVHHDAKPPRNKSRSRPRPSEPQPNSSANSEGTEPPRIDVSAGPSRKSSATINPQIESDAQRLLIPDHDGLVVCRQDPGAGKHTDAHETQPDIPDPQPKLIVTPSLSSPRSRWTELDSSRVIKKQSSTSTFLTSRTSLSPTTPSITAAYYQLHPRNPSRLASGDALANAIVASSLASTRLTTPRTNTSPSSTVSATASLQHRFPHGLVRHHTAPQNVKPTAMLHTLRPSPSSDSSPSDADEDPYSKHKKKRHFRKHPNRYTEGDRKRWRTAVTERERKRYEGVWAANKTVVEVEHAHDDNDRSDVDTSTGADETSGVVAAAVVRDIWSRSRLPDHILRDVWDLVDVRHVGSLNREEFVVGLWLIDQRLKGRKLPTCVAGTVWNSVKFLHGITMKH